MVTHNKDWNQGVDMLIRNAPTLDDADAAIQRIFNITDVREKLALLVDRFGVQPGTGCGLDELTPEQADQAKYRAVLASIVIH